MILGKGFMVRIRVKVSEIKEFIKENHCTDQVVEQLILFFTFKIYCHKHI